MSAAERVPRAADRALTRWRMSGHVEVIIDRSNPTGHGDPTFRWRCTCGGTSWIGHHETRSRAERAAAWHAHNRHGGPVPR